MLIVYAGRRFPTLGLDWKTPDTKAGLQLRRAAVMKSFRSFIITLTFCRKAKAVKSGFSAVSHPPGNMRERHARWSYTFRQLRIIGHDTDSLAMLVKACPCWSKRCTRKVSVSDDIMWQQQENVWDAFVFRAETRFQKKKKRKDVIQRKGKCTLPSANNKYCSQAYLQEARFKARRWTSNWMKLI